MSKKLETEIIKVGEDTVTTGALELASKRIVEYFNDYVRKVDHIIYYSSTNHINVIFTKNCSTLHKFEIKAIEQKAGIELNSVHARKANILTVEFKLVMGSG